MSYNDYFSSIILPILILRHGMRRGTKKLFYWWLMIKIWRWQITLLSICYWCHFFPHQLLKSHCSGLILHNICNTVGVFIWISRDVRIRLNWLVVIGIFQERHRLIKSVFIGSSIGKRIAFWLYSCWNLVTSTFIHTDIRVFKARLITYCFILHR